MSLCHCQSGRTLVTILHACNTSGKSSIQSLCHYVTMSLCHCQSGKTLVTILHACNMSGKSSIQSLCHCHSVNQCQSDILSLNQALRQYQSLRQLVSHPDIHLVIHPSILSFMHLLPVSNLILTTYLLYVTELLLSPNYPLPRPSTVTHHHTS